MGSFSKACKGKINLPVGQALQLGFLSLALMNKTLVTLFILLAAITQLWPQSTTLPWYHSTTIYQIYPRSFYDSNGDGVGDLQGIINKLDYIKQTGFETIWISPFYLSPQADHGYDVKDYTQIEPEYGTMQLAEQLIAEVHQRDMKILFDMVLNHTSEEHAWFQESKCSRDNTKADWYVWADGQGKNPPNNWKSMLGGSAWHYAPERDQWYYAAFLGFQPDLNYHNPEVKVAMFDIVRFWLDKGVDGFRLDLFNSMMEDPQLRDNPFAWKLITEDDKGFFQHMIYTLNFEQNYQFAEELRAVMDEYQQPQRFLLGEVFGEYEAIKQYLGNGQNRLHLAFLFDILTFDFSADYFRQKLLEREQYFPRPYQPVYAFSNHDRKRSISRIDNDPRKAKVLAALQLTTRGVPVVYMGEEIGMTQAKIPMKEGQDPLTDKFSWIPQFMVNLSGESLNRDECRTPVQWDSTANAGFSPAGVQTWLPVNADYPSVNVASAMADSSSLWHCFNQLLTLRNAHPALQTGHLELIENLPNNVLGYRRALNDEQFTILLNFSGKPRDVPEMAAAKGFQYSSHPIAPGSLTLPAYGVVVY